MFYPEEDEICPKKKRKICLMSEVSDLCSFILKRFWNLWVFMIFLCHQMSLSTTAETEELYCGWLSCQWSINWTFCLGDLMRIWSTSFISPTVLWRRCTKHVNIHPLPRPLFRSISPISCLSIFIYLFIFLLYLQDNSSSHHFIVADNHNKWGKWTRFRKSVGSHEETY